MAAAGAGLGVAVEMGPLAFTSAATVAHDGAAFVVVDGKPREPFGWMGPMKSIARGKGHLRDLNRLSHALRCASKRHLSVLRIKKLGEHVHCLQQDVGIGERRPWCSGGIPE